MMTEPSSEIVFEPLSRIKYIDLGFLDSKFLDWSFVLNRDICLRINFWHCKTCGYKHKSKVYVQNHVEEKHRPPGFPDYTCKRCSDIYSTWFEFVKHDVKKHNSRINSTKIELAESGFGESNKWEPILLKVMFRNLKHGLWQCSLCQYRIGRKDLCLSHVEAEHTPPGFPGYKCKICEVKSNSRVKFKKHMTEVHSDKDPGGKILKMKYFKQGYLDWNMQEWDTVLSQSLHLEDGTWKCKKCELAFKLRDYSLNHVEFHHKPPEFPGYKCNKCSSISVSRKQFHIHVIKHFKPKPKQEKITNIQLQSVDEEKPKEHSVEDANPLAMIETFEIPIYKSENHC